MEIGAGELEIHNDNGLARLTLRGEFDIANVPELNDAVRHVLWPASYVLVDLRGVTFMDARLLQWLVDLRRELHSRGGHVLVRPGTEAQRLLSLMPAGQAFELAEEEAS